MTSIDKRKFVRIRPPRDTVSHDVACNNISAMVTNKTYRMFYEVVMHRGTSGADTLREMIQEEYNRIKNQD